MRQIFNFVRKQWLAIAICCVIVLAGCVVFQMYYPHGISRFRSIEAYWFNSKSTWTLTSPTGVKKIELIINDGGAAHSGNHYCWFVSRKWWGTTVVGEGYLESGYWESPPGHYWENKQLLVVKICKSRYDSEKRNLKINIQ